MFKFSLFLLGYGLAISGGVTIIIYLNLIPAGLSYMEYLSYIGTRPECYLLLVGILFITIAIFFPIKD